MQCDAVCIIYCMLQPPDDFESLSAFNAAGMLQCVVVFYSVLYCAEVCLQCVAECYSVMQRDAVWCSMYHIRHDPSTRPLRVPLCL